MPLDQLQTCLDILSRPESELFVHHAGSEPNEGGEAPSRIEYLEPIQEMWNLVDQLGLRPPFDWQRWDDLDGFVDNPDAFSTASATDCQKFLWAVTRAERFGQGAIAAQIRSGTLRAALQRILRLYRQSSPPASA